jgi:hypothetical protein
MNHDSNSHSPKPLSPSAVLKLLRAVGAGTRLELQPEHISALDSAITALAFQSQVRQLVSHGPQALDRPAPSPAPARENREPREPRENRPARPPRDEQRLGPAAPARPLKVQPPRPTEGSGAIWTPEEETRLRAQWENEDAIGAIAEKHKRSALACFARLIRIGALQQSPDTEAAIFLIKKQQLVHIRNQASWLTSAQTLGFEARPAEAEPVFKAKPPAP